MEDIQYKQLQRASNISAILTLLGVVVVISALIFSYFEIRKMEERVAELAAEESQLKEKIEHQKAQIKQYEWASSPQAITAQTKAVELNGIKDPSGRQVYDFSIWLQVPVLLKDKIKQVQYVFDHPTMLNKTRESTEASNGYSVSYRGWGCLKSMTIKVFLKDGESHEIQFDQCSGEQR